MTALEKQARTRLMLKDVTLVKGNDLCASRPGTAVEPSSGARNFQSLSPSEDAQQLPSHLSQWHRIILCSLRAPQTE